MGLTWVGTMRKNKRDIPTGTLPSKKDTEGTTKFAFTKDKTLVTYVPKKGRGVCLVQLCITLILSGKQINLK